MHDDLQRFEPPVSVPESEFMCYAGCGCPHEEWDYRGVTFAIHQDKGLQIQALALVDENDELDIPIHATTFEEARQQACAWIDRWILEQTTQGKGCGRSLAGIPRMAPATGGAGGAGMMVPATVEVLTQSQ